MSYREKSFDELMEDFDKVVNAILLKVRAINGLVSPLTKSTIQQDLDWVAVKVREYLKNIYGVTFSIPKIKDMLEHQASIGPLDEIRTESLKSNIELNDAMFVHLADLKARQARVEEMNRLHAEKVAQGLAQPIVSNAEQIEKVKRYMAMTPEEMEAEWRAEDAAAQDFDPSDENSA